MEIVLGMPAMLTILQSFFELQQFGSAMNVLKSLYQIALTLPHALP